MQSNVVEIEVCGIRLPGHDFRSAILLLGRRGQPEDRPLRLPVEAVEAQALLQELHGHETSRGKSLRLASLIAEAIGCRLVAARLMPGGADSVSGIIDVLTPGGLVEVPTEADQALGVAVRLDLPLLADLSLFAAGDGVAAPLSPAIARFLDSLDLDGLSGAGP